MNTHFKRIHTNIIRTTRVYKIETSLILRVTNLYDERTNRKTDMTKTNRVPC